MCVHFSPSLDSFYSLSIHNSIGVEHGDYLEDVGLSKAGCKRAGAHQELQRALHYPAGVGLSGVHSGRQEDQWTIPWRRKNEGECSTNTNRGRWNEKKRFFNLKFFTAENSISELQWTENLFEKSRHGTDTLGLFSCSNIHPNVLGSISERATFLSVISEFLLEIRKACKWDI